ncbi:MAG: hypothetical protein ACJ74H_15930 [Thermoanaerobaculia bacterium]
MRRKKLFVLIVFVALIAVPVLVSELSCREKYAITIRLSSTGNPAYPYAVAGSVVGCGMRRAYGTAAFRLLLRPGAAPSGMSSTLGASTVAVRAGIAADASKGWYVATVTRNDRVIASKHAEQQLSPQ